jgi:hypothetical protein
MMLRKELMLSSTRFTKKNDFKKRMILEIKRPICSLIGLFYSVGKYMLLYSDKVTYTFPPLVSEKKLARRVPNVAFSLWSV